MKPKTTIENILLPLLLGLGITFIYGADKALAQEHDHSDHAAEQIDAPVDHDSHQEHDSEEDHDVNEKEDIDNHASHGHDEEKNNSLTLSPEQLRHFGIEIKKAGPGKISTELTLPGEIVFNEDRVAHLVPRVPGIVREVNKTIGDKAVKGEIIAVIESRNLADAKAEYLAAVARNNLAKTRLQREKTLFEKKISSEDDFLNADQAATESHIDLRTAEQKLHALGYTEKELSSLITESDAAITHYEIKAPFDGVVTAKHVSIGESLEDNVEIFTIADLNSVWINLTVYMKDLEAAHKGQTVLLKTDHSSIEAVSTIKMLTPFIDQHTRAATARVEVDNTDGHWRPGSFVTGKISLSADDVKIVVPKNAVQIIENQKVVFTLHKNAFEATPVQTGREDRTNVEIIAGLEPDSEYVAKGAFGLKATLVTSNLDSHAGHGH